MSTESVRCLYFPAQMPGREEVFAVEDSKLVVPPEFAEHTRQLMLPDGVMIISNAESEAKRAPINRRVASYIVHGNFIVTKVDSQCEPVSLTDSEVAFYVAAAKTEDETQTPADLGDDREILLADVQVTYRKVKLPKECKCGADLTRNESVTIWSFSDEGFRGRLPRFAGDTDGAFEQKGFLMSHAGMVRVTGETSIDNVGVTCVACGQQLADGKLDETVAA